jgi:hypothetical protein
MGARQSSIPIGTLINWGKKWEFNNMIIRGILIRGIGIRE